VFNYSEASNDFFSLDEFLKHSKNKILNCVINKRLQYRYTVHSDVDKIIERDKLLLEKQNVGDKD